MRRAHLATLVSLGVLTASGCTTLSVSERATTTTSTVAVPTTSPTAIIPSTGATSPGAGATTRARSAAAARAGDVAFAQAMVLHAEQGLDLGDFALHGHGASPGVRLLAGRLEARDAAAVTQLQGWLTSWHVAAQPVAGTMRGAGTVTEADFRALAALHGAAFDARWVRLMQVRSAAARAQAQQVLSTTQDPRVRSYATRLLAEVRATDGQLAALAR